MPANSKPWTSDARDSAALPSSPVKKTLATVATKRIAFVRQRDPAGAALSASAEGVAEGGGESLESGLEAGIEGS